MMTAKQHLQLPTMNRTTTVPSPRRQTPAACCCAQTSETLAAMPAMTCVHAGLPTVPITLVLHELCAHYPNPQRMQAAA
jgi:hypothetical protein